MLSMKPRTGAGCRTGHGRFESHRSSHQSVFCERGVSWFLLKTKISTFLLRLLSSVFLTFFSFFHADLSEIKKKEHQPTRDDKTCATTRPPLPQHNTTFFGNMCDDKTITTTTYLNNIPLPDLVPTIPRPES
jgi:hypothetical protein